MLYFAVNVQYRALGSLLHMIQDSYAKGHCHRELLNPDDRLHYTKTFAYC